MNIFKVNKKDRSEFSMKLLAFLNGLKLNFFRNLSEINFDPIALFFYGHR